jgi:RNA polymerase sigma-70 factor (ECF subfamily)
MAWSSSGSSASAPGEERRLIEQVQGGDTRAFGELVRRYQRRAFAVGWRLLRHREDAEDLVQDAFLTALDRIETFDASRPFGPWFFRLLVNRGHNVIDARRVRATDPIPDDVAATGASPAVEAERRETAARVAAAVSGLGERQQLVVQLHELDGFSTAEVSQMLDIAEPTVRWTLHAARKRLRAELAAWKERDDA